MASRVKKASTTTAHVSQTCSGSDSLGVSFSSPRNKNRRERPPSPARCTRQQEQEDLQGLNDRLANYIDKVRYLEAENNRLTVQIQSTEETVKREVSSVKQLYESELNDARRLLDETAKSKARIQIDANKYKSDYEEILAKFKRRDNEASALERRLECFEVEVADLRQKLSESDVLRKRLEKENAVVRSDLAQVEKQLAIAKKQLEEETLMRVDLENRFQSLKEELLFKNQVYEQEIQEVSKRTTKTMEEVDAGLEIEYESRLLEALREIREQYDGDLNTVRIELETLYENKIADLRAQADRSSTVSGSAWEELRITRKRCDDLASDIAKLKAENSGLELQVGDLESQLVHEREDLRVRFAHMNEELAELRLTLEEQTQEYSDLLDIKIRLDREIEAYRKLLESEECRLNISLDSSQSFQTNRSQRPTPIMRSLKRKRVDMMDELNVCSTYSRSASSTGGIDITEVDVDGKFIQLTNTTTKDISMGTWQLQHSAGELETSIKFHHSLVVKGGKTATVWSSDTDTTHNPPTDLVLKGRRWFIADEMKTILLDSEDVEMASCTMSKSASRSKASFAQHLSGPYNGTDELDNNDHKKECIVM